MKTTKEIIKPYLNELENADYKKSESDDLRLINKWKNRIPDGWYGFDGINTLWGKIIDDFLTELEKECPDFEIHQIKLKYGGLMFYVDLRIKDCRKLRKITKEIDKLENALFSESLIY